MDPKGRMRSQKDKRVSIGTQLFGVGSRSQSKGKSGIAQLKVLSE